MPRCGWKVNESIEPVRPCGADASFRLVFTDTGEVVLYLCTNHVLQIEDPRLRRAVA